MGWRVPTSHNANESQWHNPVNCYDGNLETYGWDYIYPLPFTGYYIEFNIAEIQCNKIRFNAGNNNGYADKIDIDVYYNGAWHNVFYRGAFSTHVWVEASLGGTYAVTKARVRFLASQIFYRGEGWLYEFNFYEIVTETAWVDEPYAYDNNTGSAAYCVTPAISWTPWLIRKLSEAVYSSVVRFYAQYQGTSGINKIDLNVYYNGAWHDVFEGSYMNQVWIEKELGDTYYVSKIAVRFFNNSSDISTAYIQEMQFVEEAGVPKVTTNAATDVGDGKATLNGDITCIGGADCTARGFKYKEGIDGEEQDTSESGNFPIGTYSRDLSSLDPTKKYYFKAYATNSAGTGYGDWKSFGEDIEIPTLTTSAATSVDHEKAVLNGNITETGGEDPEERGFQYKIGEESTILTIRETGSFGVGAYSLDFDGLDPNVEYHFRAYAKNSGGIGYGSWLDLNTDYTNPMVKTHNATNELTTQVTGNGEIVSTGGKDCYKRGFEYGLSKVATWIKQETAGGYGVGFFNLIIDGLTANTEYWYRAFAAYALTITGKYLSVGAQDNMPMNIAFSSDGTKLYFIGYENDTVFQYTLSTPWDVTTGTYSGKYKSVTAEDIHPRGLAFSTDGTKMYITGTYGQKVYQYTLSTPWDVSTATYDSVNFVVYYTAPYAIAFSTDGMKMYIVECGTYKLVYQYTLTTPWDISTTEAYVPDQHLDTASQDTAPFSIAFNSNGTILYVMGGENKTVYQYTLGTGWDVTTATYSGKSKSVVAQDTAPFGIAFNSDGTKMYISGSTNDKVYPYTLSEPWDVSTATYDLAYSDVATGYGEWVKFITAAPGLPGDRPSGYKNDVCSDYSGYTYILNRSFTDDGASYKSHFVLSTDLSGKKTLHTNKRLLDIFSYFANKGIGTAKVYIKRNNEATWQEAGEISLTGVEEIIIKHLPIDYLAKHFLIKMVFENDFEFVGLITEAVPIGDRPAQEKKNG